MRSAVVDAAAAAAAAVRVSAVRPDHRLRKRTGSFAVVDDEVDRHLALEAADVAVAEVVAELVNLRDGHTPTHGTGQTTGRFATNQQRKE